MTEYIVTGATGYVGFVLVNKLIEKGYKPIKLLVRSQRSVERFKDYPVKAVIGDLLDDNYLNEHIKKDSVVFHLAGMIDISPFNKKQVYSTNYDATKKIVDTCIKNKAKKLVYISSTSVIPPLKKNKVITEPSIDDLNPKKVKGHYAKSKALATNYILTKSQKGLLNATVAYPPAIIGPYDFFLSSIGNVVVSYANNRFPFYIKGQYNFIDVRDVADGLIKCYESGKSGKGYLLTGENKTLKEMFVILNDILNKDKFPKKVPLALVKLVLPFISLYYLIGNKKTTFSSTSLKVLNQNSNFSQENALKDLNFKPMSAYQSFKDMVEWFYENNFIK